VVVGLYDLRAEVVVGRGNVEAVAGVKVGLRGGHVLRVPGPALGADGGRGAVVGVVAARGQGETVVRVLLPGQHLAAQDEVPTDEAG